MMKSMKIAISFLFVALMACALVAVGVVVVGCGAAVDSVRETRFETAWVACGANGAQQTYQDVDFDGAEITATLEGADTTIDWFEGRDGRIGVVACSAPETVVFTRQPK
jgi:hypothetical protein